MKNTILTLILLILTSCSSESNSDNNRNNPPSDFEVSISEITRVSATINWTESIDTDNEIVKYDVYLDENLILENTLEQTYDFVNLEINTFYNGKVIAKDEFGNTLERLFSFTTESISCIPDELQNQVIAFYPFSNGNTIDLVNFNNLTNNNAQSTLDRNSNDNCAFSFDFSNNSYLTTTNTDFLNNLSEFSISLWFNATTNGTLLSRDEGFHCPDTDGQWSIRLFELANPIFSHLNSVWDSSYDYNTDNSNWHHLVVTYNETDNTLSIYRNGILKHFDTGIAECNPLPTVEDIGDLFIGKFNGKLDDIAIFNNELNQVQVNSLYEMEPCCE